MSFQRIAAIAGLVTFVLGAAAGFFPMSGEYPTPQSSGPEFAVFYATNRNSVIAVQLLSAAVFITLVLFAAGLYLALRPAERERGEGWSIVGLLGAVAASVIYTIGSALTIGLALSAGLIKSDAAALMPLGVANAALGSIGGLQIAMFAGGFAIAQWRTSVAPRWLASLGLAAAAASLIAAVGTFTGGTLATASFLLGTVALLLWVLAISVRVLRAPAPAHRVVVPAG